MRIISELATKHKKQVLLTTHNPAILDGINLGDDEQRLFVVSRSRTGQTKVSRIMNKEKLPANLKLSEAFLNGFLGGLPKTF